MGDQTPYRFVYITAPDHDTALALGRSLVHRRLAACANVLGPMTSVYRWKGAVQEDTETVLIAKTHVDRLNPLIEATSAEHPYECPCIVALPVVQGLSSFLDWIAAETSAAQ